jgi:UDP-N-acetylmuramoyl-L-alanyl-D-glutamate--2,6-diaminopimelate ligase
MAFDAAVVTELAVSPAEPVERLVARRAAMARLFRAVVPGGAAVVNADDRQAELLGAVNLDARRVAFGLGDGSEVSARVDRVDRSGSRFRLRGFGREAAVALRLAGAPAVSHALAASAVAWARGVELGAVVAGLESVTSVPGRLEPVDEGQPFDVRTDQARLACDLHEALASLRGVTPGLVHCVFGAEGVRDGSEADARLARRALAAASEPLAHRVTLTADNPRTEDPDRVLDDLLSGFRRPGRVRVEPDRRRAIESALSDARPGDAVLIAGKGREGFQILADGPLPFDDAAIARGWLRENRGRWRKTSA